MTDRADALRRVHEPAWVGHLPAWARNPRFERGFVAYVDDATGRRISVEPQLDALV